MAARSKVGQAAIRDSPTILWPPRRSAFRLCSGRLIAAAIASAIMSAARRIYLGPGPNYPAVRGTGPTPSQSVARTSWLSTASSTPSRSMSGVFGFGDQKLDRIVAQTLAAAFNALLG